MARSGRKRKQGVDRYPNGQPVRSQAQIEAEAKSVAVEARMRHHGLPKHQAKKADAGSLQGRLAMDGVIDEHDDDALSRFGALYRDYVRAIDGLPDPKAVSLEQRTPGMAAILEDVERSMRVISEWRGLRTVLGRNAFNALEAVVKDEDRPLNRMSFFGGLNLLREHYRLPSRASCGTREMQSG